MSTAPAPERDEDLERRINLAFALLNTREGAGRAGRTGGWLRRKVAGYGPESEAGASRKRFQRDIAELRAVGFPVRMTRDAEGEARYGVARDEYELPPVEVTPAEAAVLGLAGDLGQVGELATFTRSGWMKLAAAGVSRDLSDPSAAGLRGLGDVALVSPDTLTTVAGAVGRRRRISFSYRPHPGAPAGTRRMDPWRLVSRGPRLYLVGHDIDRDAPRSFRITRVSAVEEVGPAGHPAGDRDLEALVADTLVAGRETVSATVRVAPGRCHALRSRAEDPDAGELDLVEVDREWLVRRCAAAAPDAVLLDPPELRDEVLGLLREAARE